MSAESLAQADGDASRLGVAARVKQGQRRRRSRLLLDALHVLVAEPEMVPDLVDQHVAVAVIHSLIFPMAMITVPAVNKNAHDR